MASSLETLVLITGSRSFLIARPGTRHQSLALVLPRNSGDSLAESVGTLLDSHPGRLGRVWVAATDLWVGDLEVERRVVVAVGESGLAETLALEAESISGISAFSSRVAIVPQTVAANSLKAAKRTRVSVETRSRDFFSGSSPTAVANYLVLQIDEFEFEAIAAEVRNNRGVLQGIGSAAILFPSAKSSEAGVTSPQLIVSELESGTVVACRLSDTTVTWMMRGPWNYPSFIRDLERLVGPAATTSAAIVYGSDTTLSRETSESDLGSIQAREWDDEAAVLAWASAWIECVAQTRAYSLVIAPRKVPVATSVWTSLALSFAAVTAAVGGLWYFQAHQEIQSLSEHNEKLRNEVAQTSVLQKNLALIHKELDELTEDNRLSWIRIQDAEQRAAWVETRLQQRRLRWPHLLEALGAAVGDQCVIEALTWTGAELRIEGHCLTAAAAHEVAHQLFSRLQTGEWQVEPATTEFTEQQVYEFRLKLKPSLSEFVARSESEFVQATRLPPFTLGEPETLIPTGVSAHE